MKSKILKYILLPTLVLTIHTNNLFCTPKKSTPKQELKTIKTSIIKKVVEIYNLQNDIKELLKKQTTTSLTKKEKVTLKKKEKQIENHNKNLENLIQKRNKIMLTLKKRKTTPKKTQLKQSLKKKK
jgi:hypothetical protein